MPHWRGEADNKSLAGMIEPRVTVLMPVYNGEEYVREAMESILSQTFKDFEFLIINDGSTDGSVEIILSFQDKRIRLIHNGKNLGLIQTLNKGIAHSRGEYVVRMDCDDISLPSRLQKQIDYMNENTAVGVCGTWVRMIGPGRRTIRYPTDSDSIRCHLLFYSALAHPSVIFRKDTIEKYQLYYNSSYVRAEDYELWVRAGKFVKLANLSEPLVKYRVRHGLKHMKLGQEQLATSARIRMNQLRAFGIDFDEKDARVHEGVSRCEALDGEKFYDEAEAWLIRLKRHNDKVNIYPPVKFDEAIAASWFSLCNAATETGWRCLRNYWRSGLARIGSISILQKMKFSLKCLLHYRSWQPLDA
jgi:glycosyltransferase involved in cell wall biosynthesis